MEEKMMQHSMETTGGMIAQEIRKGISAGRYKTGEKIKEADLCRQFGVSRTPVREAFRLLQNEGLLIHNPQRGVQVPEFRLEELMNLQQMRAALECLSARNAAPFVTEKDILQLREINGRIREFDAANTHKTDALDREFHMTIARIGTNPYVPEFLQNILVRYELSSYVIPFQETRIPHTYKEHEDVIQALEMKDGELAEKYMSIHFHYSTLSLSRKMKKYMEETKQVKRKRKQ
ncbi:GntR family transcriptional regulator [Lachnospiraceae bacterium 54-53]